MRFLDAQMSSQTPWQTPWQSPWHRPRPMPGKRSLVAAALALLLLAPACGKNPETQAASLLREVERALSQQQWELAEKKAQEAANLPKLSEATRDQAKLKLEQARSEQQALKLYQKFVGHASTDHDVAVGSYKDMPETSYYRQLARPEFDRIRPSYVEDHLERAKSAHFNGRCDDAKHELQLILDVDAQNRKAMELNKAACGKDKKAE